MLPVDPAALRALLRDRLEQRAVRAMTPTPLRRAAVALAVSESGFGSDLPGLLRYSQWQPSPAVLLTLRAARMSSHAGQWALPGGGMDDGETPEQAALRELAEEIGLELDATAVLGRLDDYATRSGYVITPVVVWAGAATALAPNPQEVAAIHRIGFSELLRADAPILEPTPHGAHPVLKMPVGHSWIAAPTAAFLYQFREVALRGRDTPVAHFDQPAFAWR